MLFPNELSSNYGLTITILSNALEHGSDAWSLHGIPNVEFYRKLHSFLKKWDTTLTKTSIGKFYLLIDKQLRSTPYNTYRFIEKLVSSDIPDTSLMSYGSDKNLQTEVRGRFRVLEDEMDKLKTDLEKTREDLLVTQEAVQKLSKDKLVLQKNRSSLQKKLRRANEKYEGTLDDLLYIEDELLAENFGLSDAVDVLEQKTFLAC